MRPGQVTCDFSHPEESHFTKNLQVSKTLLGGKAIQSLLNSCQENV
jgi:hypothetical protein